MPQFDFSQLANVLPMLGGIAGSGGHAGVLAGLGDAAHEQNVREFQQRADARKAFADQLEKIGMDESNWNEAARTAALQARLSVLANPKAGEKEFQKHWQSVLDASSRPDATQSMAAAGHAAAADRFGSQAAAGAASPGVRASGFGRLAALGSTNAASTERAAAAAPIPSVSGPLTPGERAIRQFEAMKPLLQQYGDGTAGDGLGGPEWRMSMTPNGAKWTQTAPSRSLEFHHLRAADGSDYTGTVLVDHHTGQMYDANTRRPLAASGVTSLGKIRSASVTGYDTVDESGQPVRSFDWNTDLAGTEHRKPVRLGTAKVVENGTVSQFNRNPYSGAIAPRPFAVGTTNNRDLAEAANARGERGLQIREQGNARAQGTYDYSYGGTAIDTDGSITGTPGTVFTPAGTPTDASGAPIGAKPYSQTRPPSAVVTRAHVADDASVQAQSVLDHLESAEMQGDFGPLRGRALGWLVEHGLITETDIKGLQLQLASMESMNPAVHQMRNFAIAQDIAERLGDLGQPYENFVAGVQTLKDFYDQVAKSGVTSVVPTSPKRIISRPTAPTAPKSSTSVRDPKTMSDAELAAAARAILAKGAH